MRNTTFRNTLWICGGLALAGVLMSLIVWTRVPAVMPVHWDASGAPNGFAPRAFGLLLLPLCGFLTSAFMVVADRKQSETSALSAMRVLAIATSAFMLAVHALMIRASLHAEFAFAVETLTILLGGLVIALAPLMTRLRPNRRAGIRTPWTMDSESNWVLTHRFAKWSMMVGGVATVVAGALLSGSLALGIGITAILLGTLSPVIFSYGVSRTQRKR